MLLSLLLSTGDPDCLRKDLALEAKFDCAMALKKQADTRLEQQWNMTLRVFEERSRDQGEALREAQRIWGDFYQRECDAVHREDLGMPETILSNLICRAEMIEARVERLADLARRF